MIRSLVATTSTQFRARRDALRRIYWSYGTFRERYPAVARSYLSSAVRTRGFRDRPILAGDFIYENFGDVLAGQILAATVSPRTISLTAGMAAPGARCLLVGAGGLVRPVPAPLRGYRDICSDAVPAGLASIGLNFDLRDELSTSWLESLVEDVRGFDFVAVRDHRCGELFARLGLPVHGFLPDVALLPHCAPRPLAPGVVLVCPCWHTPFLQAAGHRLVDLYVELIDGLHSLGVATRLCPLQALQGDLDDRPLCRQIARRCRHQPALEEGVPAEERFVELCQQSQLVVSGRLHGMLVASRAGVPVLSLAYGYKQLSAAEMLDLTDCTVNVYETTGLDALDLSQALLADGAQRAVRLQARVEQIRTWLQQELNALVDWVRRPSRQPPAFRPWETALSELQLEPRRLENWRLFEPLDPQPTVAAASWNTSV